MFGQFAELEDPLEGVLLLFVLVVEGVVVVLDLVLDDEPEPLAALAIAAPPPAMVPVTASVTRAFWKLDFMSGSPPSAAVRSVGCVHESLPVHSRCL